MFEFARTLSARGKFIVTVCTVCTIGRFEIMDHTKHVNLLYSYTRCNRISREQGWIYREADKA